MAASAFASSDAPALPAASLIVASAGATAGASAGPSAGARVGVMFAPNRSLDYPANRLTEEEAKSLVALKAYLKDHPLEPPSARHRFDDFDLAKFVVVAKCDPAKCHKRMQNFVNYSALYKVDEVSEQQAADYQLNDLHDLFEYAATIDKEGRSSSFMDSGRFDPKSLDPKKFHLLIKLFFMYMDLLTSTISLTRNGTVFISDMSNFGWKNFDQTLEKKFSGLYQDCYPIKFARMLMVNPPWYMSAILAIMKLFLKKKIADRMQCVWTENAAKSKLLSTYITPEQMPAEFGGTLTASFHLWMASQMGLKINRTKVKATRPAAPKSAADSSSLSFYSNSKCVECAGAACDTAGKRVGDSRVCAVCGAWYCGSCSSDAKLTMRKEGVYKHTGCIGHKSKFAYPYKTK